MVGGIDLEGAEERHDHERLFGVGATCLVFSSLNTKPSNPDRTSIRIGSSVLRDT